MRRWGTTSLVSGKMIETPCQMDQVGNALYSAPRLSKSELYANEGIRGRRVSA